MTSTPEVHTVVKTVVENHTVIVNDFKHVVGLLLVLIPTGAALSVVHWIVERDKLSAGQNRMISLAYAVVSALVFCVLNHQFDVGKLLSSGDLAAFSVAFVAIAGSAQKTFDLLTAVASASKPSATTASSEGSAVTAP